LFALVVFIGRQIVPPCTRDFVTLERYSRSYLAPFLFLSTACRFPVYFFDLLPPLLDAFTFIPVPPPSLLNVGPLPFPTLPSHGRKDDLFNSAFVPISFPRGLGSFRPGCVYSSCRLFPLFFDGRVFFYVISSRLFCALDKVPIRYVFPFPLLPRASQSAALLLYFF